MAMFHMANDSDLFHTRDVLNAEGWELRGNVFTKGADRMLPLYEAKMIHHFDHRFGMYEGQTQAQANMGTLPRLTPAQRPIPTALPCLATGSPRRKSMTSSKIAGQGWLFGWRDITFATNNIVL